MSAIPVELLEMFETEFERSFPLPIEDQGSEYYWKFYASTGVLWCSLRDVNGNWEDFEWELTQKIL